MEKATTNSKRTHVIKRESSWAIKKEGAKRATKLYKSKLEAIKAAKESRKKGVVLVVHKADGSIQEWIR
ncbi:MAG: hypothetical protein CVV25_06710 [Ignavibacteriae bacterium HGW-Ignavibacteriae-4]|jgi:hypothetical protein|nr:MAG: hypothetical protein CVV25_06710 [Ignavibacteriae bacterium HGW-Ignavibacteriae-4]